MNRTLNYTREDSVDTVLVTEVIQYARGPISFEPRVLVLTSRGEKVWAYLDELTIRNL